MQEPPQTQIDLDSQAVEKAAHAVFQDAAESGCSFTDCLAEVYLAGAESIAGPLKNSPRKKAVPVCPYEKMVGLYHEKLPMLAGVRLMDGKTGEKRRKLLRDTWAWILRSRRPDGSRRAETVEEALKWLSDFFERATENDFLMGRTRPTSGHQNWKPDLDYLLSERGIRQVIEKTQEAA